MERKNTAVKKVRNIEKTLRSISIQKRYPRSIFLILVFLYIAASVIVKRAAGSRETVEFLGSPIAVYAFAGVFTALANICVILVVFYYGKMGFLTSFVVLILQFPIIANSIAVKKNLQSLPGAFVNLFTIIAIIIIYVNNKKIETYQLKLRYQAIMDRLTGLPNRFACSELINHLINAKQKFVIVSIDLNNFKSINNTMGHSIGNEVLKELSNRWKVAADTGLSGTLDFITRQGGDEFALIIRNYHSDDDIMNTIQYYESVLEKKITVDDCDYFLTASFGYAEFPRDAENIDSLLTYAEAAMYEVKRTNNSDRIVHFNPDLLKIEHTIEMERKIREALENGNIFFNLQPQFRLNHELRGFEALARMRDADGNIIAPSDFIPVAEKVGLIDQIDLYIFRESAKFFGELVNRTGSKAMISVNVSVRHLMKNNFLDELRGILSESKLPPEQLEIEITESVMIDSAEKALQCIRTLKGMGIKIAIDDFGTGYSSLSYLNKFPADLLKIDKSFIDKMNCSESSKQYVAAIISIGHIMNLEVISEGVEEPEQLDTLREIGCDFIQGYIWGRPLMLKDAEKLVIKSLQ